MTKQNLIGQFYCILTYKLQQHLSLRRYPEQGHFNSSDVFAQGQSPPHLLIPLMIPFTTFSFGLSCQPSLILLFTYSISTIYTSLL